MVLVDFPKYSFAYYNIFRGIIKLLVLYCGHWHREKLKAAGIVIYARSQEPIKRAHINDSNKFIFKGVFMKNFNKNNKQEQVEVMALFGYEMTPCQPLTFRRRGESETEVTELLRTQIKFAGGVALHIFDVLVGRERLTLEFNSRDLSWHLTQ